MTKLNQLVVTAALLAGTQASSDADSTKLKPVPGPANSPLVYCRGTNPSNNALHLKSADLSPTLFHKPGQEITLNLTGEVTKPLKNGGQILLTIISPDGKNPVNSSGGPIVAVPREPISLAFGTAIPKDAPGGHYLVRFNGIGGDDEPFTCVQGLVYYDKP